MKNILIMLVSVLLLTRAHCQIQAKPSNEEKQEKIEARTIERNLPVPGLESLQHHSLLGLVGIGRQDVDWAMKVLGTAFNFMDTYLRPRYPVMDSNYAWFKWVDRNLPLVLNTAMAPKTGFHHFSHDEDYWDVEYFEDYLYKPYDEKLTQTSNVIWKGFYKQMYDEMIAPIRRSQRSGATSRQGGVCLSGVEEGYSSVQVDVLGQVFKYLADTTVNPVMRLFRRGGGNPRLNVPRVDPLYKFSEHLGYLIGLSDLEDTYSFYNSRIDDVDCLDSTARVMNAVMPYGTVLTLSNLVAVGVWMVAFWAPFLGL